MTSAWIIVARSVASAGSKTSGSRLRDDVPTLSAANRRPAKRIPTGLVAAEQRDGDAREADEVRVEVALVDRALEAEEVDRAGESGERAGDGEREEVVPPHADAAVAGRLGVEADRAHLVPERRPVEDHVVDDERDEGDQEPGVQVRRPDDPERRGVEDDLADRGREGAAPCNGPPSSNKYLPP